MDNMVKKKEESSAPEKEYREQKARTKVTVGKYPFKVDITGITVKTVGKAQATVKGNQYITGRISLPREWIGMQVIILAVDSDDSTNKKSIDELQKEE